MEVKTKKYRQVKPERAKVWEEKSPENYKNSKVAVVYYLCRNRQLEHPHFMEVPMSSPDGVYLRDVTERLNALRGRGLSSLYSWSCKRSYKNGFVWHDLCEDDIILPAHGNEYVLKGSELFEEFSSDHLTPSGNTKMKNLKQLPEPTSSRSHDDYSSSSSMNGKMMKHSHDDFSPPIQLPSSSNVSPESRAGKNSSSADSLSLTEYKIYKNDGLADASTQTEENVSKRRARETCTMVVSTDDTTLEPENSDNYQNIVPIIKESSDICRNTIAPPPSSSSASSSGEKTATLESLIRADASKFNSFRILEEGDVRMIPNAKLKATNVLMQLISCGSLSVKDHNFGLIPTYKPRFSHSKFHSPLFSTSVMLGELDCLSEKPSMMALRREDKEYFSGSLVETKALKQEDGVAAPALKRSSSYNADRCSKQLDSTEYIEEATSGHSKCIPQSIRASVIKHPRSESMRSPVSSRPRDSSDGADGGSKRMTEPCPGSKQSKKLDSLREEKEKVIKIEERLASGARIIIQSTARPCGPAMESS